MSTFASFKAERRRLEILRAVAKAPAFTVDETVLTHDLDHIGHAVSRDTLRADLAWLEEQGCLLAQQPGGVWVVTLTARGSDVAKGLANCPGIAHPVPGE
jgi:DeoR/GlpR family transcriptional regulator of sugar metabolism